MNNNVTYTNNNDKPRTPNELLKVTALLYFQEALARQEYEQCPALLKTARRFGARRTEIAQAIDEVQKGRAVWQKEDDVQLGGRLRFIEEEE